VEYALRAIVQLGLEADDVVERAEFVVLAQLHDRVPTVGLCGLVARPVSSVVLQRLVAALGHHSDRQAAVGRT
jgi:hypothetical protein